MRTLVFNGWAAGPEAWALCSFHHDWVFDYLEQLDGVPERVMDEIDAAVFVGFSMGGSTALRMLLRYPGKVRGLVLVSASPCMMEQRGPAVEGRRPEITWRGMSAHRFEAFKFGTQLAFQNDPSPLYAAHNLDRGLAYLKTTDLRADLLAFAARPADPIPVRIFQSDHDGVVRPNNADFLTRVFPQAQVTLVPGTEHALPIAVPELIDAAVFDIMGRHEDEV